MATNHHRVAGKIDIRKDPTHDIETYDLLVDNSGGAAAKPVALRWGTQNPPGSKMYYRTAARNGHAPPDKDVDDEVLLPSGLNPPSVKVLIPVGECLWARLELPASNSLVNVIDVTPT